MRAQAMTGERGGATILLVWCCAAILALALALLTGIGSVVAGAQVQAIADLAALHGAGHHSCEAAADVVARNHVGGAHGAAAMSTCEIDGTDVQVHIRTNGSWPVSASARAGPTWSDVTTW